MRRIASLGSWALLLAGCADPPLSPDKEQARLAVQRTLTPPSDLTAAATSPNRVDLTWRDNSTIENGFEVHRALAEH